MLEKLRKLLRKSPSDRKEGTVRRRRGKKLLLPLFFLSLVLGIILGLWTRKVLWIFFLPCAFLALFFLFPEREEEKETTAKKFFRDFFLYASMTGEGRESFRIAVDRLPISPLKERLVAAFEREELTRKDFDICPQRYQLLIDKVTRLSFREEIRAEDLEDYRSLLDREKSPESPSILPFFLLLPLLLLTYLAIL